MTIMIRRLLSFDSTAVTGSLIGLLSLLFGWLTLEPSRLAAGTSFSIWDSLEGRAGLIVALWLICLVFSLLQKTKLSVLLLGVAANLVVIVTFWLAGLGAGRLLEGQGPIARVAFGSGIWLTVAGAYIVIFAVRQRLVGIPVWRSLVSWAGLVVFVALLAAGWFRQISVVQEFTGREARFVQELGHHLFLVAVSVAVGAVVGVLLGIWATRNPRAEKPIFFIANITQTIPSLALFGLLIAPLSALSFAFPVLRDLGVRGVGDTPAIIALIIYSLLPIVRNTYVGLRQVDAAAIDAGLGMGMNRFQVFRRIEVPLAAPLVLEGVRTASVQSVGLAAVAALIGAGGLGWFIFQGLGQAATDLILLGVIPIIILALLVDALMRTVVRLATPRGLAGGNP